MHTNIIIYVYTFYLCKCISLLFHLFVIFVGVKNKLLVLVLVLVLVHSIGRVCVPLWMHILDNDKHSQKQLDGCCTRMLRAAFNRHRQQHLSKTELCSVMS